MKEKGAPPANVLNNGPAGQAQLREWSRAIGVWELGGGVGEEHAQSGPL